MARGGGSAGCRSCLTATTLGGPRYQSQRLSSSMGDDLLRRLPAPRTQAGRARCCARWHACHPDASNADTCDKRQPGCPGVTSKPRIRRLLARGEQRFRDRCHFGEEANVIKSGSVLAINCGSSSIKFSVIDHETSTHVIRGSVKRIGQENARLKYTAAHGIGSQSLGMVDHERALQSIEGDSTLFTRQDWVELAWSLISPIIETWQISKPRDFPNYAVGNWGPNLDFSRRGKSEGQQGQINENRDELEHSGPWRSNSLGKLRSDSDELAVCSGELWLRGKAILWPCSRPPQILAVR